MSLIHVPAFCPELFACAPYRKCAQQKIEMIKAAGVVCLALLFLPAGVPAQNQYAGGIVYGPKGAFNIAAPEGWVLDNESGVEQGLPCVLYRKGESWADARTVMYAKIAGTDYEDAEKFVQVAIKQMQSKHGKPKEKIDKGTPVPVNHSLSTSILPRKRILNGNASRMSSCQRRSPTSFSHRAMRRVIAKMRTRCVKC